ncbi:MAG: ribosome-binding factor A [Fimbriiglobus sp.]
MTTTPDQLAAAPGPEDGTDPRRFHDRRRSHRTGARGPGRKAMQLCGQVRDAVPGILAGLADEVLQTLTVVSVEPAPHAGRLMVTVAVPATAAPADRSAAEQHLARAAGLLRTEVAAAVHRRRAPELTFRVV